MKMRYKQITFIGLTAILALCSCAEQLELVEDTSSSQVSLATPYIITGRAISPEAVPAGSYLFGWPSTQGKTIFSSVTIDEKGNIANGGTINVYWENIKTPAALSLSNTGDFSEGDKKEDPIDILWGNLSNQSQTNNALAFTLDHKMAQAKIELDIPQGWTVNSVQLTNLKKQYTFSNSTGIVTSVGTEGDIKIDPSLLVVMLPPQDKGDESKLIVKITDDQGNERSFSHKLPYSMAQEPTPGSGQWEDIVLRFRAGYILTLSASITSSSTGEIHFTYATLTDWNLKNGNTSSARPSGLYTVADWNEFAKIYNDKTAEYAAARAIRLYKYGSYDGSKWTFTVQRDIDMTGKTVTALDMSGSSDILKANSTYRIIGKTSSDLGISGNLEGDVFK